MTHDLVSIDEARHDDHPDGPFVVVNLACSCGATESRTSTDESIADARSIAFRDLAEHIADEWHQAQGETFARLARGETP